MNTANKIIVVEYSEAWPQVFEDLKKVYEKYLGGLVIDIQHVGSTAVPGLAAKPVIDIDLIIENGERLQPVITQLEQLDYIYEGDLGIKDREAFKRKSDQTPADGSNRIWPVHHLYCCINNSAPVRNHLQLRDYLRSHPEKVSAYGELKKKLAAQFPFDIDQYVEHKTAFITEALKETGFDLRELDSITIQKKAKS